MTITFFSVLTAVIWFDILILPAYFLHRYSQAKRRPANIPLLAALYILGMFRIIFPLDISSAIVIPASRIYPQFYQWMTSSRCTIGAYPISAVSIFVAVWAAGACVGIFRYTRRYFKAVKLIKSSAEPADETVLSVFREVMGKKQLPLSVYISPDTATPYGIGVFQRIILLPRRTYAEEKLYYILKHEYTHFLGRDTLLKQAIILFCKAFWWNPVVYLLKKDIEQAIELKCDFVVTRHMSRQEKAAYMRAITATLGKADRLAVPVYGSTALSAGRAAADLREHFYRLMDLKAERPFRWRSRLSVLGLAALLFLSYAFILQPSSDAPASSEPNTYDIDIAGSYIVHTRSGEYLFYGFGLEAEPISEGVVEYLAGENCSIIEE